MEAFFTYVVKNLVDNPEAVRVVVEESSEGMKVVVFVPSNDMSKVVGRKGRIVYALRTIGRSVGARLGHRVRVEVQEQGLSEGESSSQAEEMASIDDESREDFEEESSPLCEQHHQASCGCGAEIIEG